MICVLREKYGTKTLSEKAISQIKKYISTMDLEDNNKLPREELLAEIIGVSRVTLRSALNVLASEGVIFRRHGKGTFVNINYFTITASINQILEYSEVIRLNGFKPSIKYLDTSIIPPNKIITSHMNLKNEDKIIKSEKLFFANDTPCIFCQDFISLSSISPKKNFDDLKGLKSSIFNFFSDNFNRHLTWDKVIIGASSGSSVPEMNKYYNEEELANKAFITFDADAYDQNDTLILYSKEYIDPSIVSFSTIRQRTI